MPDLRIEAAGLSRTLDEVRRLDPEHRLLANRMAAAAAVKHVEAIHADVEAADETAEARLDHPRGDQERRKGKHRDHPGLEREEHQQTAPEEEQGHLLDITA